MQARMQITKPSAARRLWRRILNHWEFYLLLIPMFVIIFVFKYIPMYGVQIALKNFKASMGIMGSPWVDPLFKHFTKFFNSYNFDRLVLNTFLLSFETLIFSFPLPIVLALMLNQVPNKKFQRPVEEVNALRGEKLSLNAQHVERTQQVTAHIAPQFDAELVIDVEKSTSIQAGIQFCVGKSQEIVVSYDLQRQVLYVNRSMSGDMGYADDITPYHEMKLRPREGKIALRILMDHCALEVFDLNGEAAISAQVFPDAQQGEMCLFSRKGDTLFERLDVYAMNSIWDE